MRKNKVAKNVKEFLLDLIFMTVGSVIYAVGLNGFTAPNNIAPGGVSGIAIVLNYLFGTPVGTVILLINVPIIIWAIIEIGYKLVTKTMLAVVLNAACIDIVALFIRRNSAGTPSCSRKSATTPPPHRSDRCGSRASAQAASTSLSSSSSTDTVSEAKLSETSTGLSVRAPSPDLLRSSDFSANSRKAFTGMGGE